MSMTRVVITEVVLEGRPKSVVARDYGVSRHQRPHPRPRPRTEDHHPRHRRTDPRTHPRPHPQLPAPGPEGVNYDTRQMRTMSRDNTAVELRGLEPLTPCLQSR